MKGILLEEPGRFVYREMPEPEAPEASEVWVRIRRVGICGTDIHAFEGKQPFVKYPRILGHELAGEVAAVGAGVQGIEVGARCMIEPSMTCGRCIACRRGRRNCCAELCVLGVHIDGGMRDLVRVPAANVHCSRSLSLDQLALVETLCIGAHAVERAAVEPGEWVLVIGAGPIGLTIVQFAQRSGARILLSDVNEARLAFARRALGVEHTLRVDGGEFERVRELTGGDMPTAVFDATGNPAAMAAAFQYPASGGRLIFLGLIPGDITFSDPEFHRRELTLLASRNSQSPDFGRVIEAMERGEIDTRPWITHRVECSAFVDRFADWLRPGSGVVKGVIDWA